MTKRSIFNAFKREERGAVAVLFGVACPVIMGVTGVGAEVAYWQHNVRKLQNAADAASYSGAGQLTQGKDAATVSSAATQMAGASGFTSANGGSITVNAPPATGAYAGDTEAVEVILNGQIPRLFSGVFMDSEFVSITARSVARAAGNRPSCVLALSASAASAVKFGGSSDVQLEGCDVGANSISTSAINVATSDGVSTPCMSTAGEVSGNLSKLTLTDCARVYESSRIAPDPFAHVTMPPFLPSCDADLEDDLGSHHSNTLTVSPGRVCDKSSLQIKANITFDPGTYVFDNVGISINASADLVGSGVTWILTGGSTIDINGGATIALSAPTDPASPYHGIVLYGDPADGALSQKLNGGSSTSFTGAIYFPKADVQFSGSNGTPSSPGCTLLVANTVEFTGNSFFGSDCSSLGLSSPATAQVVLIVE